MFFLGICCRGERVLVLAGIFQKHYSTSTDISAPIMSFSKKNLKTAQIEVKLEFLIWHICQKATYARRPVAEGHLCQKASSRKPPPSRHCCGQYPSYWSAFLLYHNITFGLACVVDVAFMLKCLAF